jgi:protein phosphatase methylesterase 1
LPQAGFLAYDARGHGYTTVTYDEKVDQNDLVELAKSVEYDMKLETFSSDLEDVLKLAQKEMGWSSLSNVVLVGHSMGGCVIVDLANRRVLGSGLIGFCPIDAVEGSALEIVKQMHAFFAKRPPGFSSLEVAIKWHLKTGTLRNKESAEISVPSMLTQNTVNPQSGMLFVWRTDLMLTEPYWNDWFKGMSKKFLESPGGKLYLLAGTDRLDKPLMIGQMQGRSYYV